MTHNRKAVLLSDIELAHIINLLHSEAYHLAPLAECDKQAAAELIATNTFLKYLTTYQDD